MIASSMLSRTRKVTAMTDLIWKSNVPKGSEAKWAEINYQAYCTEMIRVRGPRGFRGVIYHADNLVSYYGYGDGAGERNRCWLIVVGPKGGKRSLGIGCYKTMEEAKHACEQHWAAGCDLTGTVPELTWACQRAEARAALMAAA